MATASFGGKCHVKAQEWHDGQPEDFPPSSFCPLGNELRKCYFSFLSHLECAKGAVSQSIVYPWLCVQVASVVSDSLGPLDCSPQAPLCMGFSRQEYWSGLPCPPPGDLLDPEIKLMSYVSCTGQQVHYHWCHLKNVLSLVRRC